MSRSLARRLTLAAAAASCLAAAALPAVAQTTEGLPVTIQTTGGSRVFDVTKPDGTNLTGFDFGTGGQLPWRVVVTDTGVPLLGNNYFVNTKMSNLYYQQPVTGGGYTTDYTTKIASDNLSLAYSPNPLGATGLQLPVVPEVLLGGSLTCSGLGDLTTLVQDLKDACALIATLTTAGTNIVNTKVLAATQGLDTADLTAGAGGALKLADLPMALLGAQEGGRFTKPAKADANDPVAGTDATSKRIMTGTGRLVGDTLAKTLDLVTASLTSHLGALPMTPGAAGATSLVGTNEILTGLKAQTTFAEIATLLSASTVTDAQRVSVLQNVTGALQNVVSDRLSSMSGVYSALPILEARATTIKAGLYKGTLTVDFFQE